MSKFPPALLFYLFIIHRKHQKSLGKRQKFPRCNKISWWHAWTESIEKSNTQTTHFSDDQW